MNNSERELRDRLTDEATTWLDNRACEYRYDYERIVDEMVDLLLSHRRAARSEAGIVVVSRETMQVLVEAASMKGTHLDGCALTYDESTMVVPCDCDFRIRAAIAEAEEAMR